MHIPRCNQICDMNCGRAFEPTYLPGFFRCFLITASPSVCVPEVIGVLAVWISNQKKKNHMHIPQCNQICNINCGSAFEPTYLPRFSQYSSPPVCVSAVLGTLACGYQTKKKKKEYSNKQSNLRVLGIPTISFQ